MFRIGLENFQSLGQEHYNHQEEKIEKEKIGKSLNSDVIWKERKGGGKGSLKEE